jgi:6-phosphogluconolactonase
MKSGFGRYLVPLGAVLTFILSAQWANADDRLVFISSFAAGEQGAIHAYQLDLETGKLRLVQRTTDVENPFFLAVSPNQKFLYSIHAKQFDGKEPEQVAAYEIVGRTGQLKLLNRQSSLGLRRTRQSSPPTASPSCEHFPEPDRDT